MRAELDSSELSQLRAADGSLKHSDGLKVPKWARGALTPRTPCDAPACSTQAGYHSPPPSPDATHSLRRPRLLDTGRVPLPTPKTTTCLTFRSFAKPIFWVS